MIRVRLLRILDERGWSIHRLADEAGIPYASLYRLAMGRTAQVGFVTLDRICRALGVGVGEILEYNEGAGEGENAAACVAVERRRFRRPATGQAAATEQPNPDQGGEDS